MVENASGHMGKRRMRTLSDTSLQGGGAVGDWVTELVAEPERYRAASPSSPECHQKGEPDRRTPPNICGVRLGLTYVGPPPRFPVSSRP